ncbi:Pol-like protein putative [Phytophthora palmivora]|uniref:Pol-like protein putative n=1 Tax=Phytophthora palmivora TaxID=4796 RepID=A0A2P4Y507_9STRA|nr:Pol-like protein putative [Phytophthora palmivora]
MLTNGSDGFTTVVNKKKRSRGGIDFSNMLTKQMPTPLDGVATANYFQALQTMEVKFEAIDATVDKKYGIRHHVRPVDVKRPEALKSSTESAFFVEKHHTKIRKAPKPSPVVEVTESMISDENTALLNTLVDRLEDADKRVDDISKILGNATNPDHIMKKAVESPLAFNSALSLKMAASDNEIEELVQLHMINRVLSANKPDEDTTFATKWKKFMGKSVPSKRHDIFAACSKWWQTTPKIFELARFTKALSTFELSLMSIAPTLFTNDHWIQYVTGYPIEWIPAHHVRLLHPNTLLRLLRSELGELCMAHWREVQWQGHLFDELEELRQLEGHYPADESVLQLQVAEDGSRVDRGHERRQEERTPGHLLIDNLLSKYALTCVQETKFADRSHLSNFKFHLESAFEHKLFLRDVNALLDRPTRGRSNGVLTVLRSDFPGFDSAMNLTHMTVPGRYLVVRVTVEHAPVYIHNVYAPVDKQENNSSFPV